MGPDRKHEKGGLVLTAALVAGLLSSGCSGANQEPRSADTRAGQTSTFDLEKSDLAERITRTRIEVLDEEQLAQLRRELAQLQRRSAEALSPTVADSNRSLSAEDRVKLALEKKQILEQYLRKNADLIPASPTTSVITPGVGGAANRGPEQNQGGIPGWLWIVAGAVALGAALWFERSRRWMARGVGTVVGRVRVVHVLHH